MRTTIWKLNPIQSKYAEYTPDIAREEGLAYIERLKAEDKVVEVIEERDRFVIILE